MPNDDGSDLGRLERKIPHLQFIMELFTDHEQAHRWDSSRQARFHRVEEILLNCWGHMQTYARQMANNRDFLRMFEMLKGAVEALGKAYRHIEEAPVRMQRYLSLLKWDHPGGYSA